MTFRSARSVGIFALVSILILVGLVPYLMLQKISTQKSDMSQSLSRLIRAVRVHDTFDKASREYENALKRLERDFSPAIKTLEKLIQELKSLEEVFAADSNSEEATSKIREFSRTAKRFKAALISYAEDLKYYPAADPPQALERVATGVKFQASKTFSFLMKETISQYVSKTIQLGRLPVEDDFKSGGCGPSCGCSGGS